MSSKEFIILQIATDGNKILLNAKKELSEAPSEKIRALSKRIPEKMISVDNSMRIVFAGQYGAGKSTILKALTDRHDIAIGGGITTQETHSYNWNGLEVIDTPGIHTQLRPDHDEISYKAISEADLIVFVITNELFDDHLGKHFRKLAIDRDKIHEMLLVVNKMNRCARGNVDDMHDIIKDDLNKVLSPFTSDDIPMCFIDAEQFNESKIESDLGIAAVMHRKSRFDFFVDELNRFVTEKGIIGRYTTPLYTLEQLLQEAITAESSGDIDLDAVEELLLQRRRVLLETIGRIRVAVNKIIHEHSNKIREQGNKVADRIHGKAKPKDIDRALKNAEITVQEYADKCGKLIENEILKIVQKMDERIADILKSELAKELIPRLSHRIKETKMSPRTINGVKKTADLSQKLGQFLISKSFTPGSAGAFNGMFKLGQYSGTETHIAIKTIGQFFGKQFKPWEAVKWAKCIANAGRALAVVGTVLTFVLQIKEDIDAKELEDDLRESRASIRKGFNDAGYKIEKYYNESTEKYLKSSFYTEIQDVDDQLNELREMRTDRSNLFSTIERFLCDVQKLIKTIHSFEVIES
ncbi:MAG TPA: 50S ribosome-binding GTPase [Candidatus Cloacimonadota bacterium]|nr:50S ribosome-binding GTPase [Candidatus Cloacimonadota bacterium]